MDFQNAQLPTLAPLRNSFTVDEVEEQLRDLFCDLFEAHLAEQAFDINVLGAGHLGSFNLVKKMVNLDGLVFLPGEREEPATRYVYRAWKAKNNQGRGLHFLRTYLQLLFPGLWTIEQQMQDKALPYPTALSDRSATGNDTDKYLTSRVNLKLDVTLGVQDTTNIIPVISSIVPARIVPRVILVLYAESQTVFAAHGNITVTLKGSSEVTEPEVDFGDANYVFAARGNVAITLRGRSTVSI